MEGLPVFDFIYPRKLAAMCPLDNGRLDFDVKPDSPGLGRLVLPSELMEMIIKHLDIPSVTTLRRVSKRAMNLVDSTFEYKMIIGRAPLIIRVALMFEARGFTLNDAYITAFEDKACANCGRIVGAHWIHTTTCERACTRCLVVRRGFYKHITESHRAFGPRGPVAPFSGVPTGGAGPDDHDGLMLANQVKYLARPRAEDE